MLLAIAFAIACIALVVAGVCYWHLITTPGRSAADPDKETPPAGWTVHGTSTSGKSVAKPTPPPACFVVEPLPQRPHRLGGSICAYCLHVIPDGETVWMKADTGEVWHVRCRDRRATIRGG